jgi:hypothetical protein
MTWQVVSRPEAQNDIIEIAAWYDSRSENLGDRFVEQILTVLDELTINPLLHLPSTSSQEHSLALSEEFPLPGGLRSDRAGEHGGSRRPAARARHHRHWKRRV